MLNFFLNSIHGFGLVWKKKLFEGDMRSGREEVITHTDFCVIELCEYQHKNCCVGDYRGRGNAQ